MPLTMRDWPTSEIIWLSTPAREKLRRECTRTGRSTGNEAGHLLEKSLEADALPRDVREIADLLAGLLTNEPPFGGPMPDDVLDLVLELKSGFSEHEGDLDRVTPAIKKRVSVGRSGGKRA